MLVNEMTPCVYTGSYVRRRNESGLVTKIATRPDKRGGYPDYKTGNRDKDCFRYSCYHGNSFGLIDEIVIDISINKIKSQ